MRTARFRKPWRSWRRRSTRKIWSLPTTASAPWTSRAWISRRSASIRIATIALSHLIFEGTLDRFPGLKICAAHGGGYLPSYAHRSDAVCSTFPDRCTLTLKKKPTEYLRQLHYDSIVFEPEAMRHLIAEVGVGQIVMGTDYPYHWNQTAVDRILATPGASDADLAAMLGGTASRLLGIKPA
jgi:aminocarboxymuconate-semialdehyde decarboxylase